MSGLFSLSEHDRWKMEGEGKHSRLRRQLWNLGEHNATNLGFAGVQWCTVGSQGGTQCFRRRGRENERKWQQMKLAGCEVLFSPACSNEQAFRTHWRNWSPVGPEPSLFHLSGVFTTCGNNWKHTHTCGSTCWAKHCLHALIHSYCKKALVYDQVVPFHSLVSLWWCVSSASSHAATMPLC